MKVKKGLIIYSVFILIFFLIEANGLNHIEPGDENIYFYMGKLVSQGKVPYRDFFFAHTPLKLYIIAPLIKLFGFNLIILKLIPLIATIISSFVLFKLVKDKFGETQALIAAFLFLFSLRVMLESTYFLGVNLATTFIIISFYLLFKGRYFLSGIFSGLAGLTALYSLIPVIIMFIYLFLKNRKKFLLFLLGFSLTFILISIIFLMYSNSYYTDVFKYHLLKPKIESDKLNVFSSIITNNLLIFITPLLFLIIIFTKKFRQKLKQKNIIYTTLSIIILYLIFLLSLNKIFNYYFITIFPFMAILGSYSFAYFYKLIKKKITIPLIIIISIYIIWSTAANIVYINTFDFTDFNTNQITENIETQLIFGDDSTTPLIALLANKQIAFDIVDTNDMVFKSKVKNLNKILERLKKKDITLILRPYIGIGMFQSTFEFANKCSLKTHIKDKLRGDFLIYLCNEQINQNQG